MKRTCSAETYNLKNDAGLLYVEIVHLNKYSIFIVLRSDFKFNKETNLYEFEQDHMIIPASFSITKEEILDNFSDWVIAAKDNENLVSKGMFSF